MEELYSKAPLFCGVTNKYGILADVENEQHYNIDRIKIMMELQDCYKERTENYKNHDSRNLASIIDLYPV